MTELKFTVNAEDPEALSRLAEIFKSIAFSITCGRPACNMDEIIQTGATPPTTIEPQLSTVPEVPGVPDPELQTQTKQSGVPTLPEHITPVTQSDLVIRPSSPEETPLIVPEVTEQPETTTTPFSKLAAPEVVDSKGRPWDARIHSGSKKKLQKTGEWKLKRGVDTALVTQIFSETTRFLDKRQFITPGVPLDQTPAAQTAPNTFTTIMSNVTKWVGEGTMTQADIQDVLTRLNVPNLEFLQTSQDPDLCAIVNYKLEEKWQLVNAPSV
ncbi:MAG: hypothetical protein KAR42_15190 [candidate division Zixibacteria bacterium]|nr:hypothetical protein [candidate division Zixibacteria bacterium]